MKDKRLEEATQEYYKYQEEMMHERLKRSDSEEEQIGKYDALFGRHLDAGNPLLSPKMANIVR